MIFVVGPPCWRVVRLPDSHGGQLAAVLPRCDPAGLPTGGVGDVPLPIHGQRRGNAFERVALRCSAGGDQVGDGDGRSNGGIGGAHRARADGRAGHGGGRGQGLFPQSRFHPGRWIGDGSHTSPHMSRRREPPQAPFEAECGRVLTTLSSKLQKIFIKDMLRRINKMVDLTGFLLVLALECPEMPLWISGNCRFRAVSCKKLSGTKSSVSHSEVASLPRGSLKTRRRRARCRR